MLIMKSSIPMRLHAPTSVMSVYGANYEEKLAKLVERAVPSGRKPEDFFRADVFVSPDQKEKNVNTYVYYLLEKTYLVEKVKIIANSDLNYISSVVDFEETPTPSVESLSIGKMDYGSFDFVVATPVPEISSALAAVEFLESLFKSLGFKTCKLLGNEASVGKYQEMLKSGLKGFVNIGHGCNTGIMLSNGLLEWNWFDQLMNQELKPDVIFFNSCQVFNNPLLPSIMKGGARTFIGGILNLLIGPSEEVCKSFWQRTLNTNTTMAESLRISASFYPEPGAFGIDGDKSYF